MRQQLNRIGEIGCGTFLGVSLALWLVGQVLLRPLIQALSELGS